VARILGVAVLVSLLIGLSAAAFAQIDEDDRASAGEWIFFVTLTAIVTAGLVLLRVVWYRRTNPHTHLPSRIKRRRARGPIGRGPLL
jgi:protein-S-isoprenylcysteine O-methyltransferase Ste14